MVLLGIISSLPASVLMRQLFAAHMTAMATEQSVIIKNRKSNLVSICQYGVLGDCPDCQDITGWAASSWLIIGPPNADTNGGDEMTNLRGKLGIQYTYLHACKAFSMSKGS